MLVFAACEEVEKLQQFYSSLELATQQKRKFFMVFGAFARAEMLFSWEMHSRRQTSQRT